MEAITDQAGKLSRLVGQLLDVSRLEAGKLGLEYERTDLVALVEDVAARARLISDRHQISVQAPSALDAQVDPLRLEQVLTNLVDNAVKYSPGGGPIDVTVFLAADNYTEICVTDHGLGIPVEKRAQIFERFYQAHAGGNRRGLGLGLYISQQIVEQHGGVLRAAFPTDGGTRFIVRLPLQARA
jgi:signal transduction histidine kinase